MTTHIHKLYLRHGTAIDCARLARELSTPEHGVSEFEAFCKVIELLDAPARLQFNYGGGWAQSGNVTDVGWIIYASEGKRTFPKRIILLDGTIIREWSAQ